MTVRERALELLHEVSGLLEQLLGEVEEEERDTAEPEANVEPERSSEATALGNCPQGGDHSPVEIAGHNYCEKCNALLELEGTS